MAAFRVTFTWGHLDDRPTIYSGLKAKIGREPTHRELCDEVRRILQGATEPDAVARRKG